MNDTIKKYAPVAFLILSGIGAMIWGVDVKTLVCTPTPAIQSVK